MTISGPDALRAIEEALRDIRREEDEAVHRLARSVELTIKLRAQEAEIVRHLAAQRLDPEARAALSGSLLRAEAASAAMLQAHEGKLDEAEAAIAALDAEIATTSNDRAALRDQLAAREAELGALAAKARPTLGTDPGYAQKLNTARELASMAEQALRKTAQAEADREHNERPYRDDPLFMYLHTRGYGTRNDRANALSAWFDRRIAALIGYEAARTHFAALNDAPLRWREHAERLQERARAAAAEIAAIESVAVDSAGGRAAREAMEALSARLATVDAEVVALQDRRDEALRAERELALGNDPDFIAALAGLDTVLVGVTARTLVNDARSTPKGQDVSLAQQLDDLIHRGRDEADETQEHRSRLKTLAARRRDLEDIEHEIKTLGFDSPQSILSDNELIGETLNALLRGELTAIAYWEQVRARQTWASPQPLGITPRGSGFSRPRSTNSAEKPRERLTSAA